MAAQALGKFGYLRRGPRIGAKARFVTVHTSDQRPRNWTEAREAFADLTKADFARSTSAFHRITASIWRAGQVLRYASGFRAYVVRRAVLIADIVWTQTLMGAELPHEVWCGPGVKLEHGGRGVILHPSVSLGAEVTIYHRVTIGVRDDRPAATVGNRVEIGVGAALLGPIVVADGTRIGANAVVTGSTEPDFTYVGVPARRVGERRIVPPGYALPRPAYLAANDPLQSHD